MSAKMNYEIGNKVGTLNYGTSTDEKVSYDVYTTYDYDKFKNLPTNRGTKESIFKRGLKVLESIAAIGPLPVPIIVNENMAVLDGQARLTARKMAKLPIEYVIIKGAGAEIFRVMNQANTVWKEYDYIKSRADEGNPNFMRAFTLNQKYGYTFVAIYDFAADVLHCGSNKKKAYFTGSFEMSEEQFDRAVELSKYKDILYTFYTTAEMNREEPVQAVTYWFMTHTNMDINHLIEEISLLETYQKKYRKTGSNDIYTVERYTMLKEGDYNLKNTEDVFKFMVEIYNNGLSADQKVSVENLNKIRMELAKRKHRKRIKPMSDVLQAECIRYGIK